MKFIQTALIVFAILTSSVSMAQNFGHVNTTTLMEAIPDRATAQRELQAYSSSLEAELKMMSAGYESALVEFEKLDPGVSEEVRTSMIENIMELEKRIQTFQENAQESIQKKETELLNPIVVKIQTAIKLVAAANGYDYVLDSSTGVLMVMPNSRDITELVKKKLGI